MEEKKAGSLSLSRVLPALLRKNPGSLSDIDRDSVSENLPRSS